MKKPANAGRAALARNGSKLTFQNPTAHDAPSSFPPHVATVLADADRAVQGLAGSSHHRLYQILRLSAGRLAPADAFYVGFYQEGRRVSFPYSFDGREYDDPSAIPYGDGGLSAWILEHRRPYWSREDDGRLLMRGQSFGDTEKVTTDAIVVPLFVLPLFGSASTGTQGPEVLGMMSMQSYTPGVYDAVTVRAFAWLAASLSTVLAREREDERRRAGLGITLAPGSQAVADEVSGRLGSLRREVEAVARLVPEEAAELSQAVSSLREGCERAQTEIAELLAGSRLPDPWSGLTSRQREVARLLADGLAAREIAARLFISEHTVKDHLAGIRDRLGFTGRSGVAALLHRALSDPR
jgi:DNA-binding CsgD family transcriptional regulator